MLRATNCRSGFVSLLFARSRLFRLFYAITTFESDASPPRLFVSFSEQSHTSDIDQRRTTACNFHPVKSHRRPSAFQACPSVLEQPAKISHSGLAPLAVFSSAASRADFLPCLPARFYAMPARMRTAKGASAFAWQSRHTAHALPGFPHNTFTHQTDDHFFKAHGRPAFFARRHGPLTLCCQQVAI